MKGQMVAVEQTSIAKKCGIQFQGPDRLAHSRADRLLGPGLGEGRAISAFAAMEQSE